MRIGILTQYYPPEVGAPQARLAALAQSLAAAGDEVTVLTAMPNYPAGRIQPGYGGLLREERRCGVRVIRSFIAPSQRAALLPRLTSYFSFVASATVAGLLKLGRMDVLIVESPPLFLALAGMTLARRTRARLVMNISDLWPESAVRLGLVRPESLGHRLSAALEARCYRRSWLVSAQTTEIVASIRRRFPGVSTCLLSNGADCVAFSPERATASARAALGPADRCIALYAGLHGLAQGLDQLLDAAARLPAAEGVDLVLMGDGPTRQSLVARAERERLAHVRFLPTRAHAELPALLASADMVLVPLHRSLTDAVPSKLYEALASGRPIILIATGQAAEIVREAQAGIVVPHDDPDALVAAVRRLGSDPALRARLGANGRAMATARFDRARINAAFAERLHEGDAEGRRAGP
jgi:glycosyltransferase involved in cell wall biosynthesis